MCLFFSLQCSVVYSVNTSEWHLVLVSGMVVFSPGLIYSLWLQQNVLAESLECSQVMGSGNGLGLPNKVSIFRPGNWQQWYPPNSSVSSALLYLLKSLFIQIKSIPYPGLWWQLHFFFSSSGLNYLKSIPRKNLSLSRDFPEPLINSHGLSHHCSAFALLFHYE